MERTSALTIALSSTVRIFLAGGASTGIRGFLLETIRFVANDSTELSRGHICPGLCERQSRTAELVIAVASDRNPRATKARRKGMPMMRPQAESKGMVAATP